MRAIGHIPEGRLTWRPEIFLSTGGASVPLLQSATIPASFRHGFSTRAGGVSAAPYHSLNLGSKWGDSPENVAENRRRLLAASGARAMYAVSQKHGTHVVRVAAGDDAETVKGWKPTDCAVTRRALACRCTWLTACRS